jgi:hypothetical protein
MNAKAVGVKLDASGRLPLNLKGYEGRAFRIPQ